MLPFAQKTSALPLLRYQCINVRTTTALAVIGLLMLVLPLSTGFIPDDTVTASTTDPLETTECELYDEASCQDDGTQCSGTEHCIVSSVPDYARCYVMWLNSTQAKVTVLKKGCFYADTSCRNQTECVGNDYHKVTNEPPEHNFCCCVSNFCNRDFSRAPPPQLVPKTTNGSSTSNSSNSVLMMVLCTLGSLIIMVVIIAVVFYCYRKSKMPPYFHPLPGGGGSAGTSDGASTQSSTLLEHTAAVSTLCPPIHRPVQLLEIKAKGRFGALWMATCTGDNVAVKIFPASDFDSWHVEKEVYGLPQFRHPNVLEFMGVEKHGDHIHTEYWLISAYHYRGSLSDYLKANVVSWSDVRRIAESMAQGLCFLHEEQPACKGEAPKPIIAHRDFKSKNVLLKADLTACIADFGLAIVFYQGQSPGDTHGQVGTRRYMAPEVLEGAISFQADAFLRIDMYACGLVLWELLARCSWQDGPVGEYRLPFEEEVGYHPTLDDMQDCVVVQKCRPAIKKHWLKKPDMEVMVATMEECWDHDSEARLTAACVVERLSKLRDTASQYSRASQCAVNAANNAVNAANTAANNPGSSAVGRPHGGSRCSRLPPQKPSNTNSGVSNVGRVQMSNNINTANNMASVVQQNTTNVNNSGNVNYPHLSYPNGSCGSRNFSPTTPVDKYRSSSDLIEQCKAIPRPVTTTNHTVNVPSHCASRLSAQLSNTAQYQPTCLNTGQYHGNPGNAAQYQAPPSNTTQYQAPPSSTGPYHGAPSIAGPYPAPHQAAPSTNTPYQSALTTSTQYQLPPSLAPAPPHHVPSQAPLQQPLLTAVQQQHSQASV